MTEPTLGERSLAASLLDGLNDVGDDWDQQVEHIARGLARARRAAQIAQLRDASRVLLDRASVLGREP